MIGLDPEKLGITDEKSWENVEFELCGRVYNRNKLSEHLESTVKGTMAEYIKLGEDLANDLKSKGSEKYVLIEKEE